jgi:hypothetical protein
MTLPVLRAQPVLWPIQNFTGNICGLNAYDPVTLSYDPAQDNTGNGGGSCYVSTDYSEDGLFQFTANNVACCGCALVVNLQLSNYTSVDFDVKWDNFSTVPLAFFNTNDGPGTEGIIIGVGSAYFEGVSSICYSNVIIPDAATNGWAHVSAAINQALTNISFGGITFEKTFPGYGPSSTAAFWLDNLQLLGPTNIPVLTPSCEGSNFTVNFPAIQFATYTILKSTDFVDWTSLATGYPPGGAAANMVLSFTDTNASGGQSYYRVRSP